MSSVVSARVVGLDPLTGLEFVATNGERIVGPEPALHLGQRRPVGLDILWNGEIGQGFIGERHSCLLASEANVRGVIHDDHPFKDLPADRDPVRQFRGRLVAPVTVVTAGQEGSETALTVSSLMVAEGEPSSVIALIGTNTDLWEAIESSRRFVRAHPQQRPTG